MPHVVRPAGPNNGPTLAPARGSLRHACAVTVDKWHVWPSGAGVAALVGESLVEAYFPAAAVGFIVGFAVKLGAGIAAAGATWVALWVILSVRAIRARSWRDGIHVLVVRNRWWTYRVPLASIQEVRTGRIGFGANPAGVIVRATDPGRNPWHRIRGLPIDGTASYSADRMNTDVAAVRHMIADARRRANN
jgi:hypothetical protein